MWNAAPALHMRTNMKYKNIWTYEDVQTYYKHIIIAITNAAVDMGHITLPIAELHETYLTYCHSHLPDLVH